MAFVVEDGTGRADATAYLSVADADAYFADRPNATWAAGTTTTQVKQQALIAASDYLDRQFGAVFKGFRWNVSQRLAWPRYPVVRDGVLLLSSEIPRELEEACAELAARHIANGGLMPDLTDPSRIVSESVEVGPVKKSTTYAGAKALVPLWRVVEATLAPLLLDPDRAERG